MGTAVEPAAAMAGGVFDRVVMVARREPARSLAWVLAVHVVVWTTLPMLVCRNLQFDLVEGLALGKEWRLGYWKHPPLPWWLDDVAYRLTGSVEAVYLLGPLAVVLGLWALWRFARDIVEPVGALVAVLALEGLHFFNFSAVKFNHDVILLPFWVLTGWFVYRAIAAGRMRDWLLAGVFFALAFWAKYAVVVLAATIGLLLVLDPQARKAWRTPGPYVMAAAFLLVASPNLWWLATTGFQPLHYADERAVMATQWYQYLWFPALWIFSQIFYLAPTLTLLAVAFVRSPLRPDAGKAAFARRYVTALALGPFAVTTLVMLVLGRRPVEMWGYPLWTFVPLAAVMWWAPLTEAVRARRFAATFAAIFALFPLAYAASELFEPFVHDRPKASQFPGRLVAETITREWRQKTGTPLYYVGGAEVQTGTGEFAVSNIAVYSPDRPHVIVYGDPDMSPWIDTADLERRGAVLVWEHKGGSVELPEEQRARFPRAEMQPLLILPRQTLHPVQPAVIAYAFVPPLP